MDVFGLLPVLAVLNLSVASIYPESALIAYHFHWSKAECLNMSCRERRLWLAEIEKINAAIAKGMKK